MNKQKIKEVMPTVLFGIGIVGVFVSEVVASMNTLKAEVVFYDSFYKDDEDEEINAEGINEFTEYCKLSRMEKIKQYGPTYMKETWKCYIPTFVVTTLTISSLIASHRLTTKQIALLSSAVASAGGLVTKYRQAILDRTDEEVLHQIDNEVAESEIVKAKSPVISSPDFVGSHTELDLNSDEEVLFFDEFTGQKFYSSKLAFLGAKYYLNRNFQIGGGASLQMFYAFLGLTLPEELNYIGWDADKVFEDGYCWIDIDCVKSDKPDPETGKPYYTIIYGFEPGDNEYSYSHYPGGGDPLLYDGSIPLEA